MQDDPFALLQKPLREQVTKLEIAEASGIQRLSIPPILEGKNVLLIAPTGTGKTLAAVLPVFDLYVAARSRNETRGISILYVTPLRALNRDILRRLTDIGAELGIKVQVRHGDTPTAMRVMQARTPPDMLITTPETFQAILPGKRMRQHLRNVRWVIVDEIHELATDKRGVQLALGLERLRNLADQDFQRIGLSATVGEEQKIAKFLAGSDRTAAIVKSREGRGFEVQVDYVSPTSTDRRRGEEFSVPPSSISRARHIAQLIREKNSVLVFTNTREHAEAVGSQLKALDPQLQARVHHGSLSKEIREEVERDFQNGNLKAVVCTSSLELGIDVGSVDFIIQYMSPRQATRLIQRIGRSEHRLRGVAKGLILGASADDVLESYVIAQNAKDERLEPTVIHENALDVLAHQTAGIILDLRRLTVGDAFEIVKRAYPYRDLTPEAFMSVVKQLQTGKVIRIQEDVLRPLFPNTFTYYYENLSMIPDVKRYIVFDFFRKRKIGTLDQDFVARKCKSGTELIMHGQTWKVIAVNEDELSVEVEPTAPTLNAIPSWEGEIIPVSFDVANEVGHLRGAIAASLSDPTELARLTNNLRVTREAMQKTIESIRSQVESYPVPTDAVAVIEKFENCIVLHTCLGTLANETVSLALASLLSARLGVNVFLGILLFAMFSELFFSAIGMSWGYVIPEPTGNLSVSQVVLTALALLVFFAGKRLVTVPRMGVARFGPRRRARLWKIGIVFVITAIVGLLFALEVVSSMGLPLPLTAWIMVSGLGFGLAAYLLDFSRLYFYAALFAASPVCFVLLKRAGFPVAGLSVVAVSAAIMIAIGIVLLLRFLKKYPRPLELQ